MMTREDLMNKCPRCDGVFVSSPFCKEHQEKFDKMVQTLRLAYIHQRGHPDKKTLWVNVEE